MARVRVVLVRPDSAVNVGATARVVRNYGLRGLDLVSPGDWRTVACWRTAWGAQEVLEEARVFPSCAPRADSLQTRRSVVMTHRSAVWCAAAAFSSAVSLALEIPKISNRFTCTADRSISALTEPST